MRQGKLVLDDRFLILLEYQNKTQPKTGNRPGDAFVKWALRNNRNGNLVDLVAIREEAMRGFVTFPDDPALTTFDADDRKFVAVACAHPEKPPILQAADSKWLDWAPALKTHGVAVTFLCQADIIRFGEWCAARHSIPYERLPDLFLLFDVYDRAEGGFWATARRDALAGRLGLAVVPVIFAGRTTLVDLKSGVLAQASRFGLGPAEGVVIRRQTADWLEARAKLVRPEFIQAIDEHWRRRKIEWNRVTTVP